ncbi:MAG: alpha/beta hydrolase [Reyranella sp.]|nr:alpha/beta hydrolase [Reyranella sp.]
MTPVAFDGCFGWLHAPREGAGGDVAVLICPSLMEDAVVAHCSLRSLADGLAATGYWVLRFDHPGTGDSSDGDIEGNGGHWAAWQQSIDAAATWLRTTTGAKRLVLCGLRIGATLAALATARRDDIAGLVLFEPVLGGHSYVRQLRLDAEMLHGQRPAGDEGLAIREFRFSARTLEQIAAVDLRRLPLPAGSKVAVFARSETRRLDECVRAWTGAGAEVARLDWEGLTPLVHQNIIEEDLLADFSGLFRWLEQAVPPGVAPQGVAPVPRNADPEPAALRPPGCIETPLTFGGDRRLFGMLCQPAQGSPGDVVIIGNVGREPHYGTARHTVAFARRLASVGIASLRIDYAGLGDSLGPAGRENIRSHVFNVDRGPDVRAAVDALEQRGFRRFALQGVCSGAYHAFHGALYEPRISELLLVNIPLYTLPDGDVRAHIEHRDLTPLLQKLVIARSWQRLFSGQSNLRNVAQAQLANVRAKGASKARRLAERLGLSRERSFAQQALATLSKRGVRTLFLFSPDEGDIAVFAREFGRTGADLDAYPGAAMRIVPGMDHSQMKDAGRDVAERWTIEFLAEAHWPRAQID